jgi:hypothetical protein
MGGTKVILTEERDHVLRAKIHRKGVRQTVLTDNSSPKRKIMAIFDFKIITYMKRFIFSLAVLIVLASHLQGQTTVKALRVLETLPNTSAWVLSGQEQLTGQAFQQDALISYNGFQYTVYYNATRNVTIARRALPSGTWKEVVLPHRNTADDAHNVISMGICKNDGTIHLSYDHHNTTLRY